MQCTICSLFMRVNFVHLEMVPSLYDSLLFKMIYSDNLLNCFSGKNYEVLHKG